MGSPCTEYLDHHTSKMSVQRVILGLCVIALLLSVSLAATQKKKSHSPGPAGPKDYSWDFAALVMEWPGTQCANTDRECYLPAGFNSWTIHGLWPNRAAGGWPQFCPGPKFNTSVTGYIGQDMTTYWPSYWGSNTNQKFWSHEWEKHGTCAMTSPTFSNQYNYFKNTIQMRKFLDVSTLLSHWGIVPSANATYKYSGVLDIISFPLNATAA